MKPIGNKEDLHCVDGVQTNWKGGDTTANGGAGYGQIPNVGGDGLGEVICQKYAQLENEPLVVYVRANGPGFVFEMILERLRRTVKGMSQRRVGVADASAEERPGAALACHVAGPRSAAAREHQRRVRLRDRESR